jgi:hypothetical protein
LNGKKRKEGKKKTFAKEKKGIMHVILSPLLIRFLNDDFHFFPSFLSNFLGGKRGKKNQVEEFC